VAEFIINDLTEDELNFQNPLYQHILSEFADGVEKNMILTEKHFVHHPDPGIAQIAIDLMATPYELSEGWKTNKIWVTLEQEILRETVISSVLSFKSKKVEQMIAQNQKQIKEATGEEEVIQLMQRQQRLKQISRTINRRLGRIVTR
jgi:DNA primase